MELTRLAGYQPQFFPRLHYYNRILSSDIFEISDYVQFVKKHAYPQPDGTMKRDKSFQADSPIKLNTGVFFLTVPVRDALLPINKTEIVYSSNWSDKILKTIAVAYAKSKNFDKFYPEIKELLGTQPKYIGDLNITSTLWGINRLITDEKIDVRQISVGTINKMLNEIENPFRLRNVFLASESPVLPPKKGKANDWIIDLCKYAKANEYYFGGTSHSAYMDTKKLEENGITCTLQDWKCLPYSQQYPKLNFISNLSVLDLIMNTELRTRQEIIGS